MVHDLLGGGADRKTRLPGLASSSHHVSQGDSPLLVFHGTEDATVLIDQSKTLVSTLTKRLGYAFDFMRLKEGGMGEGFFRGTKSSELACIFKRGPSQDLSPSLIAKWKL